MELHAGRGEPCRHCNIGKPHLTFSSSTMPLCKQRWAKLSAHGCTSALSLVPAVHLQAAVQPAIMHVVTTCDQVGPVRQPLVIACGNAWPPCQWLTLLIHACGEQEAGTQQLIHKVCHPRSQGVQGSGHPNDSSWAWQHTGCCSAGLRAFTSRVDCTGC